MEFKVTLDREAFKALASDTRLDILKALDERSMTVSELGRRLTLNKATVFEHLEKLVQVGLVKKHDDEGRKWVYYSLSWKGRRILHPERTTIALLLSTAFAAGLSGVVLAAEYARILSPAPPEEAGPGAAGTADTMEAREAPALAPPEGGADAAAAMGDPALLYAAVALFVLVALLAGIALWYWKQARARDAGEDAEARRRAAQAGPPPGGA